jgi:hypothetical protein
MHKRKKYIFCFLSFILITTLWLFQYQISVNVPWWDDFHGIILPVYHLFSDIPFSEKLKLFFSLNNEHRVVNDRVFLLLIYLLSGTLQLKSLALLGFINLIGIFFLVLKVAKPLASNYLFLLPLPLLIFHAQYFESLQSLMVPFQNFSVILYVFLTFYFLIYKKLNSLLPAFLFAILAIFSHGNGILAFLIGFIILLFNKRNKDSIIWGLLSCVSIASYFWGYQKPEWSSGVSASDNPWAAIKYVLEFFGAYALNISDTSTTAKSLYGSLVSTLFGFGLVLSFLTVFLRKYAIWGNKRNEAFQKLRHSKTDQFIICVFGFVFATGLMIGISRTGFAMLSRYTINSSFMVIAVYLFLISNAKHKNSIAAIVTVGTFSILTISYLNNYDIALFNRKNAVADGINYQKNGLWSNQYIDSSHVAKLKPLLVEPYKSKSYVFPTSILDNYQEITATYANPNLNFGINDGILEISGIITDDLCPSKGENGVYFSLESDSESFLFPALQQKNNLIGIVKNGQYFSTLYRTIYPIKLIPKKDYKIFQLIVNQGKIMKFDLQKTYGPNALIR